MRACCLQVDDAWLAALWDRIGLDMGLAAFRDYCSLRIDVLNYALRDIPPDRVRYHHCWGSWHGPHMFDLPLEAFVDLLLKINVGAYLIESANARHEHEVAVWERVKLPEGKVLGPRRGVARDAGDRASGARRLPHPALRPTRRRRKRHRGRRLWVRGPRASADRLGQARRAGRRGCARSKRRSAA